MKLQLKKVKPVSKVVETAKSETKTTTTKKTQEKTQKTKSTLPPDTYKDEIPPVEIQISDSNKLVISVKRNGDLGLPCVDIRHYVMSETYTGFTKKGINFPIEYLDEFVLQMTDVRDDCDEKGVGID